MRGDDRPASPDAAAAQLQAFAEESGFVLAPETFRRTVVGSHKERPELASGSEHTVWFDNATKRVIKLTHPDLAGDGSVGQSDLIGYLKSLDLQNQLFQDDIRLEGIVSLDGQFPQVVISQPFVKGREATAAEISMFMEQRGFRSKDGAWHNGTVTVSDAVRHNVMAADTRDGSVTVVPFDLQVSELSS